MKRLYLIFTFLFIMGGTINSQIIFDNVPPLSGGGNTAGGVSFNFTTNRTITVENLRCAFSTATGTANIWYNTQKINGAPNVSVANGWVNLGSATFAGQSPSSTNPIVQTIPINLNLTMLPNDTFGFFIQWTGNVYPTTNTNIPTFSDGTVTIICDANSAFTGTGTTPTYNPRQINGGVIYNIHDGYNDAAVSSVDSPTVFCAGPQDVYATIQNFGQNQIDSVEVHWELNGVSQPMTHYKQLLDTINGAGSNTATILLGTGNFVAGNNDLKVYTSLPNGIVDTLNNNDTINSNLPTATPPTSLTTSNITITSVDVDVIGALGDIDYEYGPSGYTVGTGTMGSSSTTPFTISGLSSSTRYDLYVRSNCGGGDFSTWSGPYSFRTPCTAITAPYFNSFDFDDLDVPPLCWTDYETYSASFVEVEDFTGTAAPFSGPRALYLFNSNTTNDTLVAISPHFTDLTAGDKRVRFHANSDDPITQLIVGTMADTTNMSFNPIDTITFPTPDTYQEVKVEFTTATGYNGTDEYVYFMHNMGATSDYIRIDEFYYEVIPSCLKPENLRVDGVTANSATINWDEMNLATQWYIEYGPLGFTPGNGIQDTVNSKPHTITGLNSDSIYEFYVISNCGRNDISYYSISQSFRTATTIPFFEDFESFGSSTVAIDQQGWKSFSTSTLEWESNTNTSTTLTGPVADHTIGSGGTFVYLETNGGSTGNTADLVSPPIFIDPSISTVNLSFWYHKYGSTMEDLEVYVDAGGNSTLVATIVGETHTNEADPWLNFSTYLSGYSGQTVQLRFSGSKGSSFYGDMAIDDVSLTQVVNDNASVSGIVSPEVICPGTLTPVVSVKNSGGNTINSVDVIRNINGILDTVSYTGTILPNQEANVTLNPATFNIGTSYDIQIYTAFPNGNPDADNTDDTLSILNAQTALTGNYSIDASQPSSVTNYQSFNAAATDLHTYGVCGPVVFTVAPDTYVEQMTLNEITGANNVNTITFDGVDPSNTIISHDGTGTEPVILLDGADYITISNLNIVNTGTSNSVGVLLTNDADYNTVSNNVVEVYTGSTSNSNYGIVSSGSITVGTTDGSNANHTIIDGNHIIGGYYGIHLNGISTDLDFGNYITNNVIDSAYYYGIYVSDLDSVVIEGNTIDMQARGNSLADGIWLNEIMHFFVLSNTVNAPDYGIYAMDANSDFTPNQRAQVINNMVVSIGDYGIYLNDALDIDVFHNSVSTFGTSQDAFYVFGSATDGIDIRNNIFVSANAPAFDYNEPASTLIGLDNNIYYSGGSVLARVDGTSYNDLSAFQAAHPTYNLASLQGDPVFVDPMNDLHILPGGLLANNAGDNTVGVSEDIDGETRPHPGASTVDIGADEFTPPAENISPISLVPGNVICAGTNAPIISIGNFGTDTINSFDVIYSVNGVFDTVSFAGTLVPMDTQNVTLNNITFNSGTLYDLVFMTANPNGVNDDLPADDTLSLIGMRTSLNGNYTIDPSQPTSANNYQSFNDAANDLHAYGVCGPVVFDVAAGTYNEQLTLNQVEGSSSTNTITFDGNNASNTIITHDGTGIRPVILLDGADYITITNLNIINTGTSNSVGVVLTNEADYNTISNNIVEVYTGNTSSLDYGIVSSGSLTSGATSGSNASYTTIDGNYVIGGYYGIRMNGLNTDLDYGNLITNNTLDSIYYYGIYVSDLDSVIIEGNTVDMRGRGNINADGIWLNEIMHFYVLSNIVNTQDYGIYSLDGNSDFTPNQRAQIINNMVVSTGDYGLYLNDALDVDVFHNSISTYGATQDAFYVTGTVTDGLDIRNNIFVSDNSPAIDYNAAASTLLALDYNIYYSGGSNLIRFDGTDYADLASFQAAYPTLDNNSLEGQPTFVGPYDLHRVGNFGNNVGDNSVGVTEDIDGDPRPIGNDTVVDIGADEYEVPPIDVAAFNLTSPFTSSNNCYSINEDIIVELSNFGLDSLDFNVDSVDITVDVSGTITQTLNYTVNNNSLNNGNPLAPVETLDVIAGDVDMSTPGAYYFDITISTTADGDPSNNNFQDTVIVTAPIGGNVISSVDTICTGDTIDLSLSGSIGGVQWQRMVGTSFVDETGANDDQYRLYIDSTTTFRAVVCDTVLSDTVTVEVVNLPAPTVMGDTVIVNCGDTGVAVLTASSTMSGVNFNWYDSPNSNTILSTGDTLLYEVNTSTGTPSQSIDTFYVSTSTGGGAANVGAPNNGGSTGYTLRAGLEFDVMVPSLDINGVYVYPLGSGAGTADIILEDANGIVLQSITVNLTGGSPVKTFVPLNFTVPIGNDYKILAENFTGGVSSLVRDFSSAITGTGFPFEIPGVISINQGILTNSASTSYYYFYDWEVSTGCESPRVAVIGEVQCVVGIENNETMSDLEIYPNPSNGIFNIVGNNIEEQLEVSVFNSNGKMIYQMEQKISNNFNKQIDLSGFSKGIYFIRFQKENAVEMRKIIVQ